MNSTATMAGVDPNGRGEGGEAKDMAAELTARDARSARDGARGSSSEEGGRPGVQRKGSFYS